ncbi:phosphoribosyltransferase [Pseudanabaena sp. PCC 6802]|uniref:phosphoribosyltransferase n=1 Tax=Pseudanabaena sp. PCC 6802 TaxID=118173 RepID=UPI00034CC80A|nr:phosphoribosyltransferase family protein [Pseudanabaena sp. PCC 6802]
MLESKLPVSEPTSEISVTWQEYHQKIETLAYKIYQSGWEFNQILCLARGGLRVGDTLSRLYKLPLAILSVSSYGGTGDRTRGAITFSPTISMTTQKLGSRVLLVDDLVDSGTTLAQTLQWLKQHDVYEIEAIETAVIWYKACSAIAPDFYVDYLPDSPWIHQPFEIYEHMDLSEMADDG